MIEISSNTFGETGVRTMCWTALYNATAVRHRTKSGWMIQDGAFVDIVGPSSAARSANTMAKVRGRIFVVAIAIEILSNMFGETETRPRRWTGRQRRPYTVQRLCAIRQNQDACCELARSLTLQRRPRRHILRTQRQKFAVRFSSSRSRLKSRRIGLVRRE